MTGLNLETFLRLLRADLGAWLSLALVALVLALMAWTSWGSRRALRNCLVLSIMVHLGAIFYGSTSPALLKILSVSLPGPRLDAKIERVKVTPVVEPDPRAAGRSKPDGAPAAKVAAWDRELGPLALLEASQATPRPDPAPASMPAPAEPSARPAPLAPEAVAPEVKGPEPVAAEPLAGPRPAPVDAPSGPVAADPAELPAAPAEAPKAEAPADPSPSFPDDADLQARARDRRADLAAPSMAPAPSSPRPAPAGREPVPLPPSAPRLARPEGPDLVLPPPASDPGPAPSTARAPAPTEAGAPMPPIEAEEPPAPSAAIGPVAAPSAGIDLPEPDVRRSLRPSREAPSPASAAATSPRPLDGRKPVDLARATPTGPSSLADLTRGSGRPIARRPLAEVPPVYRSRLDPNRATLAQRAGASVASEQAVERALDWLARHQDADGRWDGGTAKFRDGQVAANDDSFTMHCPAGEVCAGECYYWEADTALTGLSLLAYLGAGYTHLDGKYATTVGQGIDFLRRVQKPDGDLRGQSLAVGMYCHAMASLALCEAYALTGDVRLKPAVDKAIAFLVESKARDGMAWRYAPGAPIGDTSILGWAVMALKSAKTVGIPIPQATQAGLQGWLKKVAAGRDGGLARYQPGDRTTPTMTAEAWACRQFLEIGGPGPASDEAAASLLENPTDRGDYNIYYLYYGTLAMYQHGGEAWAAWNARVRDQVVRRQHREGHKAGSWDPDDSPYGTHGGRIYGTALATLTLEVYYRFLRLYDAAPLAPRPGDPGTRRAGFDPRPKGR